MATARRTTSGRYVALLRGINVGGKNLLPMKTLVAIFEQVGCEDVRTYIQSGNVVFRAPAVLARQVPELVPAAIAKRCRLQAPVIVRSKAQFEAAIQANPFVADCPHESLHVLFLSSAPTAKRVRELDPDRSPGDRFAVVGREVFVHLPNGVKRSKLTNAWFDAALVTTSTGRNWRTVGKIAELLDG